MLTYADVCGRMLTYANVLKTLPRDTIVLDYALTYADVC
jgi:hypothetical protein